MLAQRSRLAAYGPHIPFPTILITMDIVVLLSVKNSTFSEAQLPLRLKALSLLMLFLVLQMADTS